MSVPAWLLDIFAAVMLGVAAVSAARLAIAWRAGRRSDPDADIDVSHLLMGLAMAGTLTASLSTLPSGGWEVIFGALTAWFAYRVAREYRGRGLRALVSEHHAPHLLHSAAMLYMFLALRPPASHAGSSARPAMPGMSAAGLRLPTLALLFAFLLCAYVVADLDRVPAPPAFARLHLTTPTPTPSLALALTGAPAPAGVPAPAPATPVINPAPPAAAIPPASAVPAPALADVPASADAPAPTPALATPAITPAPPVAATPPASPTPAAPVLAGLLGPGVARGCRIAMGVTMAFMLITMI
jgi:Domain of unknown function (DUF5134)